MVMQAMAAGREATSAEIAYEMLIRNNLGPYFGTPCGVLSPLLSLLEKHDDYHVVSREDNALGMAAGAALAGHTPTVLMQNSGLGQSVNALASLVVPYRIPMLLVISMRGVHPDLTAENLSMGRLTEPILNGLDIPYEFLSSPYAERQLSSAKDSLTRQRRSCALLVRPDEFSWKG